MTDSAYRERAYLIAHLATLYPSHIGYTDPKCPDWAVITVQLPTGQCSWHIAPSDMDLFTHVRPMTGSTWDGHTTEEKYQRLHQLTLLRGKFGPHHRH
jgi:hypothetical protein